MAKPGDELRNLDGEHLLFIQTAGSTHGELLEIEVSYKPNSSPPPSHYHPNQEERFEVLAGTFQTKINEVEQTYYVGDKFAVPPGVKHKMHNISDEVGRLNWQTRPALATETFFETLWGLARDGKTNPKGVPNLFQVALIGRAYAREFRLASPPYFILYALFAILTPIAKVMGYQARYAKYSREE